METLEFLTNIYYLCVVYIESCSFLQNLFKISHKKISNVDVTPTFRRNCYFTPPEHDENKKRKP